jgi:CubicO group peptidase (beta-lactamase class C family)
MTLHARWSYLCMLCTLFALTETVAPARAKSLDAQTEQLETAARAIGEAVSEVHRLPGAFPAVSAVVVHGETTPLLLAQGELQAGQGASADANSRFYIASQTKSFVGLLAVELDAQGVLPLATTLADLWPDLRLPAPAEPARITLADLLSHQAPLSTDTLNLLTAYVREVPATDYPALLAEHTEAREPGFRYANLGYLIYGAALEARTGARWQTQLRQHVLQPLQLSHVHARSSDAPAKVLAWNHQWDGTRWLATSPKPDVLMHAAGGLYASSADMARWLRANLRQRSPSGRPSSASFERAQMPVGEQISPTANSSATATVWAGTPVATAVTAC